MGGILIVDDYPLARTTIKGLLGWREMYVCGEAKDGKEAVDQRVHDEVDDHDLR